VANPFKRIAGAMAQIPGRIAGEISKLRSNITVGLSTRSAGPVYKLNTTKVDYLKARALYNNEDDGYKLGAGFAKPIVNTAVGFMGVPSFRSEDPDAQDVLDDFFANHVSHMQQTHRDAIREGDCYVWITREEETNSVLYPESNGFRLVYNLIPPEQVSDIVKHPLTGAPVEYVLKSDHAWKDEAGNNKKCRVTQRISAERRKIEVDGDVPEGVEIGEEPSPWGFIPIVHFMNEADTADAYGRSDLEAVEPFLKAYHDVMLHAIQGSKLHSTPRLKLHLRDIAGFLQNNFGVTDPAKFVQEGRTISLEGHELLIFQDEEDAGFIEVKSATGDAAALLKLLFYCIIDVSETPEFAFGTHMSASHASVTEQMPVLIRRIARKREHFTEGWQLLARIVLAMTAQAEGRKFSTYATTLLWDEIDPRDESDVAETLQKITTALSTAMQSGIISQEAAAQFLAQYIETMNDWLSDDPEVPGERERIIRTKIIMRRIEDGDMDGMELEEIGKALDGLER
jgi:hypothetical protein